MEGNIEKVDLDHVDWKSSREFFDSLSDALDKLDDKDESYDFTWVGKRKSIIEAGTPINKTLRPDVAASKDFDNTKNMLIVGDNLDALKLLQESYLGKIKMIYIDPPYNTGHDFVYRDNFTTKKSEYTDSTTGENEEIVVSEDKYLENSKANGRFHSDWLSMMHPRLKLARNLLTDDGVIFISIDDNEQANLKKLCDEIYGEDNFVNCIVWYYKNSTMKNSYERLAKTHEYVLCYRKTKAFIPFPLREGEISKDLLVRFGKYADENNNILYKNVKQEKSYLSRVLPKFIKQYGREPNDNDILQRLEPNYVRDVIEKPAIRSNDFRAAYGVEFSNPKNPDLLSLLLKLIGKNSGKSMDSDFTLLDFFAGSGTTGHAAMQLNAEDGGNRRYILVQLDERVNDKSEAKKAGYDTIDQITAERLRRAGDKIQQEHPDVKLDTGFRVFRIDSSNEKDKIRKSIGDNNQSDMFDAIDNIKKDRTPLDLLFGVISHSAMPLDLKLETKRINNNTVYCYGYLDEGTGLVACFDDDISEETIKEIANLKALTAAFKDSSFADSVAKINLSEHFRVLSPDTKVKVI